MNKVYSVFILRFVELLIPILFISCRNDTAIEQALFLAGDNRIELEKARIHYKTIGDKEKINAINYLIENMPGHGGVRGRFLDEINRIYQIVINNNKKGVDDSKELDLIVKHNLDSLENYYGSSLYKNNSLIYDVNSISANYLIRNVDDSFYMWKNMPWCKHVDFEDFCEFILPYRIHNEPLSDWRRLLSDEVLHYSHYLKDPSDPLELCKIINDSIYPNWKHLDNVPNVLPSAKDLNRFLGGTCNHHIYYMTLVFRSLGIPTCIDETPQNNDWKDRHSWIGVLAKNGKVLKIDIGNPNGKFVSNVPLGKGGATKVYRNTFANNEPTSLKTLSTNQIPDFFKNVNKIDVTKQYNFTQRNITINLKTEDIIPNTIFLCAPDLAFDIRAVAASVVKRGKVKFDNVGYPGLYFFVSYSGGKIIYHANPIYIDNEGKKKDIVPRLGSLQEVTLYQKFKPSDSVLVYVKEMIDAKIQGSNSKNFDNPIELFSFSNPKAYFDEVELESNNFFQYFRYLGNPTARINIAELEFIGKYSDSKLDLKIKGFPISNITQKGDDFNLNNAFDGDIRTNYLGKPRAWIGIDLKNKKATISKIRYLVRNHFNIVEVNDFYELFYFDGQKWISRGVQRAKANYLKYKDVPTNTLYVLKNLSRGKQERMFMYENGEQFFF